MDIFFMLQTVSAYLREQQFGKLQLLNYSTTYTEIYVLTTSFVIRS